MNSLLSGHLQKCHQQGFYTKAAQTTDRPLSELQLGRAKLWKLITSNGSWMGGFSKEIYSSQRSQENLTHKEAGNPLERNEDRASQQCTTQTRTRSSKLWLNQGLKLALRPVSTLCSRSLPTAVFH